MIILAWEVGHQPVMRLMLLGESHRSQSSNPGSNYNLDTTIIGIDSPRDGKGFNAGTIRFVKENGRGQNRVGGGVVHQIEMTDHGMGYQFDENTDVMEIISIEGDGVDANLDGFPDAK